VPDLNELLGHWGYLAIYVVVVLGNLGLPVPEETVLLLAGYLVWIGRLRLPAVLMVSIVSAVAGDNVGYWLGRHYGNMAIQRYGRRLFLTPKHFNSVQQFVPRYGPLGGPRITFFPGTSLYGRPPGWNRRDAICAVLSLKSSWGDDIRASGRGWRLWYWLPPGRLHRLVRAGCGKGRASCT
jgi:hypothetical protein